MNYNTIIFDLDGTLLNSLKDLQNSVNYALFGLKQPKKTIVEVREAVGNGVEKLIERCIPEGLIDIAIGQNKDTNKKPAPDTVYLALDYLNSNAKNAVFVGDSEVDIQTAKNSKLNCISVSWGYKTKEFLQTNGAQIIIDTPLEIFNYL